MYLKIRHALIEYFSHLVFIGLAYFLYFQLPYFQNFIEPTAKQILTLFVKGYIFIGLVYFIFRDIFWSNIYLKTENKSTVVIRFIISSVPKVLRLFKTIPKRRSFMDIKINEKTRVAVLSIIVKFFFIPIMTSFFVGNVNSVRKYWTGDFGGFFHINSFLNWGYFVLYNLILVIDTAIFTFGYLFEAKWLNNEIKSVDPYLSGWVFALICYPPFNVVLGNVLSDSPGNQSYANSIMIVLRLGTLFCYLIYVWATVALWTKSSNLTNRGIIEEGPYKFIRHPAYSFKNIAWWLETAPYITSWMGIFSILVFNAIYIMRALTEERHLLRDPAYQVYVKKVRWRFIPGLV